MHAEFEDCHPNGLKHSHDEAVDRIRREGKTQCCIILPEVEIARGPWISHWS